MSLIRTPSPAWLATVFVIAGAACKDESPTGAGPSSQDGEGRSDTSHAPADKAVAGSGSAKSTNTTSSGVGRGASAIGTANAPDAGDVNAPLADAQIISVLSTSNASVIEHSAIAAEAAQAPAVKALAEELAAAHLAGQERLTALVSTANLSEAFNVSTADNAVSQQLQKDSQSIALRLRDASEARFDALYLQAQIDLHARLLELIDTRLLPNVDSVLLRGELQRLRAETVVQLQRARALAASLDLDIDAGVSDSDAGL